MLCDKQAKASGTEGSSDCVAAFSHGTADSAPQRGLQHSRVPSTLRLPLHSADSTGKLS